MDIIKLFNENQPKYETTLPFSKEKVLFNAFKVKDAKKITMVIQEQNKKLSLIALYECLSSNSNANVLNMTLADAEYLFLQMRTKSMDEYINVNVADKKVKIKIDDLKIFNKLQDHHVNVGNNIILNLKTPRLKQLLALDQFSEETYAKACIESLSIHGQLYYVEKFVPKEFEQIIDNLPLSVSKEINEFVKNEPSLKFEIKTEESESEVTGFLSFFI